MAALPTPRNGNGNGNGTSSTITNSLPVFISTVVVCLTILGGFWQLADPRSELRDIKSSYLTLREHDEFLRRVNKDTARIESDVMHQTETFQTQLNARQSKEAADQATLRLEQRITDIQRDLRDLRIRVSEAVLREAERAGGLNTRHKSKDESE